MKLRPSHHRRGFTLVELAIVLGVFAIILGGLWSLINLNRQKVRVQQSLDAISYTVDNVRSISGSVGSITSTYAVIMPTLTKSGAIPPNFARAATSTCYGTVGNYADTPWKVTYDTCGTFRVCAWNYVTGGNTACYQTTASGPQFFAIELDQLDYGSCVALTSGIYPTHPAGLVDVYVNKAAAILGSVTPQPLPVPTSWAMGACTPASTTNIVDFVYRLRPPPS